MKIYLDDIRPTPVGWIGVRWPGEMISLIRKGGVTEISLDHDLGDDDLARFEQRKEITGQDVLDWLEEQCADDIEAPSFKLPVIHIHTANASARPYMEAARASILKRWRHDG